MFEQIVICFGILYMSLGILCIIYLCKKINALMQMATKTFNLKPLQIIKKVILKQEF